MIRSGMVAFHKDLEPLMVDIDTVQQHPENYNNGDVDGIAESIELNGMYRPIYVQDSTGYIIAGNHTWEACKQLGADRIPVVRLDADDLTAYRIMVADNRLASKAMPDTMQLVNLLVKIGAESDHGLHGTGYDAEDLTVLTHLSQMELEPTEDIAQWPSLHFQVHPRVKKAFMKMTREADSDSDRFELLLRLAGWDGR